MNFLFLIFLHRTFSKPNEEQETKTRQVICHYDEPCNDACTADVCEYFWNIEYRLTNTWRTRDYGQRTNVAKGSLRDFSVTWNHTRHNLDIVQIGLTANTPFLVDQKGNTLNPLNELENLFFTDGQEERRVITTNGHFPGPSVIVNKGAKVIIHVKSALHDQAFTLHWHGQHMMNNYWMDGGAMFSQCPVNSFNEFTYVIEAENTGTHWYHSHKGLQRADGLHGAFIVLEEEEQKDHANKIPFVMTDWYRDDSDFLAAADPYRYGFSGGDRFTGTGARTCTTPEKGFLNGAKVSSYCVDSILVNGHGQFRHKNDSSEFSIGEQFVLPYETETVELKAIHAGFEVPILVRRADSLPIYATGTDGRRIKSTAGHGLIFGVGETWNIESELNGLDEIEFIAEIMVEGYGHVVDPDYQLSPRPFVRVSVKRSSAPFRGERIRNLVALEPWKDMPPPLRPHEGRDVTEFMDYDGNLDHPSFTYLNCPLANYRGFNCVGIMDFLRDESIEADAYQYDPAEIHEEPDQVIELNLNLARGSSINGIKFAYPYRPFFDGIKDEYITPCTEEILGDEGNRTCTQIFTVQKDELVEIRISAAHEITNENSPYEWTYHALHLHGYEFFVQELGFPRLDEHRKIIGLDDALTCIGGSRCPRVEYREDILKTRRLRSKNTVAKNTILVPAMGYAIVRFRATNPGIWPMHCHQLFHNAQGMAVALNVEDKEENKPYSYLPKDFPTCADYDPTTLKKNSLKKTWFKRFLAIITHHIFYSSSISLVLLSALVFVIKSVILPKIKNRHQYKPVKEEDNEDQPLIEHDDLQHALDCPHYTPANENDNDEEDACEHNNIASVFGTEQWND
ncbi:Oidioi.mRNA.OKI2018_I69.chr2.g5946.t1.cds [Oikopleura dioica]|uniref:ferroxidase n=1 Tax=Oikopleura dioica TaxID=34765 RepID=A0ABN7T2F8_OIKDI|nr:Oidioi.mRNA.OKI2018_I69.chr2.g5946.t1.cds [Oikopleura dioica]